MNELQKLLKQKNQLLTKFELLSIQKKSLFGSIDINQSKSDFEKRLDKQISELYSEINQIILKIRKIK